MISSFKIAGGKVITINIVDILKDDNPKDDSKFGEFNPANNVITIAKRVRADYLRENKYTLLEDDIDMFDENVFVSDFNVEDDVAKKLDLKSDKNNEFVGN